MWYRCTTACSLTVRRSQALSAVDRRRANGVNAGFRRSHAGHRCCRVHKAITQRHLRCIGDPSKTTDTRMVHQ